MTATRYMDNHAAVLPHRATGYGPADAGFRVAMSNWEQLRDGAVQTSLDDLGKWDANFYSATVGGHAVVIALTTVHRLTSGAPTTYGLGLVGAGRARGMRFVRQR
jgi:hypothetical protein